MEGIQCLQKSVCSDLGLVWKNFTHGLIEYKVFSFVMAGPSISISLLSSRSVTCAIRSREEKKYSGAENEILSVSEPTGMPVAATVITLVSVPN